MAWDYTHGWTVHYPRVIQVRVASDLDDWLTERANETGSCRSDVIREMIHMGMITTLKFENSEPEKAKRFAAAIAEVTRKEFAKGLIDWKAGDNGS